MQHEVAYIQTALITLTPRVSTLNCRLVVYQLSEESLDHVHRQSD